MELTSQKYVLTKGDKNNNYFHQKACKRKIRNMIIQIKGGNGTTLNMGMIFSILSLIT